MTKTDILLINKQCIVKTNRFAKNNKGQCCFSSKPKQLIPDYVSLCKSQVKQIFNKLPKGSKNDSLWIRYGVSLSIRIYHQRNITNSSRMLNQFLYLFWKLFFLRKKAIFSVCILLDRHDYCLLHTSIQSLTS